MEAENKRRARAYKVYDKVYTKALERGREEKKPLAQLIEKVVGWYSQGHDIGVFQAKSKRPFKIQ